MGDLSVGNPGNNEGRSSGSVSPTRHLHHRYCGNQTLRPSRVALDIGGRLMGVSRLSLLDPRFLEPILRVGNR